MAHPPEDQLPLSDTPASSGVSRRSFIKTAGASAVGASLATAAETLARTGHFQTPATAKGPTIIGPDPLEVTLNVNGKPLTAKIDPATTLLEALRINHNLTGAKEVCDRGSCGACSVIVDGRLITSCMMLALDAVGASITTVEGLAKPDANGEDLDPVQKAFVKHDAMQCGFCTPGLVMACRALLNETPKPTLTQIKAGCAGNICRCGTYTNVFNACLEASNQEPISDSARV